MENSSHTFESVWAALQESNRILTEKLAETNRILTEKQAETDRILSEKQTETDRILREKFADLKETQAETYRQIRDNDRILTEKQSETDRLMKTLGVRLGGMGNSHGSFAEEYFFSAFDNGKTDFFGEKFDEIEKNLKNKRNGLTDEYDIVMFNHSSVAIIEAKYKAHENDVPVALKKVDTFRSLFPDYKDFKIYLGLASMSFYPELEEECKKQGIAIIKQVGDKVVICDENLKVF